MSDWISVEARLPQKDEFVLVASQPGPGEFQYAAARLETGWANEADRWRDGFGHRVNYVTHWQKIEPPKDPNGQP